MAKNIKNPNRLARRSNRTQSKLDCLANAQSSSGTVNSVPSLPRMAWKLGVDNRWSYVVLGE